MRVGLAWLAIQAALVCLLPAIAYAADTVYGDGLRRVSAFAWVLIFALSTISGLVALLNRVRKELVRSGHVRWPKIFAAAHMTASWLAGLIAFLLGMSNAWNEWVTDLAIILASFGGAVFIEKMADKWLSKALGYDVTGSGELGPPEDRAFADTEPNEPSTTKPKRNDMLGPDQRPPPAYGSSAGVLDDG